ncbi:MAG: chromosome partitioning protein ParB, partial [Betaproteobacteria bacterium]|nr:chromosome partitioning protein ParB [Betaproteobacteria bacterium]
NNFSVAFCEALLLATPNSMLQEVKPKVKKGITAEQILRMERELANVQGQYKLIEQTYGEDVLNLTVAKRYIGKLMERDPIKRFIKRSAPEIYEQFEAVLAAGSGPAVVNQVC